MSCVLLHTRFTITHMYINVENKLTNTNNVPSKLNFNNGILVFCLSYINTLGYIICYLLNHSRCKLFFMEI